MSRSGYVDDWDSDNIRQMNCWRGAVASAIRGKRGQAFLRELVAAMDATPEEDRWLISGELEHEGSYCALGIVGKARGMSMEDIDPEDYEAVAAAFGLPEALAREVMYENDDSYFRDDGKKRWNYIYRWAKDLIRSEPLREVP